jgi:hypothetical protein
VPVNPPLQVSQDLLEAQVREQAVIGARVLPELPIQKAHLGEEGPAPVRRHHPVGRAMEDEQGNGEGFSPVCTRPMAAVTSVESLAVPRQ